MSGVGGVAPSDSSSAGNSATDLIENTTPPLVLLSSRVKASGALAGCVNEGVVVVRYPYETTSLSKLLQLVSGKLKGRPALCVALILDGTQSALKLCSGTVLSELSVREDSQVRDFLKQLVGQYLYSESRYARLDLLLCPLANTLAGDLLLSKLKQHLGIPVFASPDILGSCISEAEGSIRIGTLYFDSKQLKEHWSQPQTMALFERIKTVGKGAYGAAVLYRKKDDNSLVVLKEINLMELSKQERSLALNEVQILSMLDHPNIISYYDNFEEEGVLMIEMEYADGGTLAQYLRQQTTPMPEPDILHMFNKMVDALRYLHDHKILHRDLKTANIFLMKEGDVKLGDFGISKVLTATNAEANTVLGTPFYISPEICEGKPYNAKSDIWALGCILYEMACLERTFEGTNLPAVIHKIVQGTFAPIRGGYSDGFRQLVMDMLQKEPEVRPSANDLYTLRLPELLHHESGEEEEEESDEPPDLTKTKSFLYHLDCLSFLLRPVPTHPIKPLIDHVSVGYGHVLAVTYDHTVYSWGEGGCGQLGHGDTVSRHSPLLVEALKNRPIIRVECGGEFSIFISDNRIIMSCGRGDRGALGHGPASLDNCTKPKLIEELLSQDTVGVACGESHVVAITSEGGGIFTWGDGRHGCLGNNKEDMSPTPQEVSVQSAGRRKEVICAVRCGLDATMFLTETGRVYACGNNQYNKLGLNQRQTFLGLRHILNKAQLQVPQALLATPLKELGKHRVVDMSLGPTHSCLVIDTGKVFTFGRNSEGQLCSGNLLPTTTPIQVRGLPGKPTMVTCSELATIVTTQENSFLVWGSRPLIKSPLHSMFTTSDSLHPLDSGKSSSAPVVARQDSGRGPVKRKDSDLMISPSRRVSFEIGNSQNLPGLTPSNSGHAPLSSVGGSREGLHRSSSLNLSHLPHAMTSCPAPSQYMAMLTHLLPEQLHGRGMGRGEGRRGVSVSSEAGALEGVIMAPTSVDLVGRCGLLSDLSAQGLQQAKLEGVSNFAGNVLILIEAKIPEEKPLRVTPPKQPLLMMSKRLIQRRHWNKRRLATPTVPEFKPPQASDFEPTLSARLQPTRTRSDSEPHPPSSEPAEEAGCELEESKVPTWILHEEQLARATLPHPTPPSLDILSPQKPTKPRPKNFAVTPDLHSPLLPSPGGGAVPLSPSLSTLQSPMGVAKIAAEPVRLPTPANLKPASSISSIPSRTSLPSQGGQKFNPLNVKKSLSQVELEHRGPGKPPSLTKHSSLTQVKHQLARVSVSSRDSLKPASMDSLHDGTSSSSSSSPLLNHRKASQGSLDIPPPLPKLAVRELHKTPPKQAASMATAAKESASHSAVKESVESAEVVVKKSERELELEGEIEKLKGDLAKQQDMLKENLEIMKTLQQQFKEFHQSPTSLQPTSPTPTNHSSDPNPAPPSHPITSLPAQPHPSRSAVDAPPSNKNLKLNPKKPRSSFCVLS